MSYKDIGHEDFCNIEKNKNKDGKIVK